MDEVSRILRNKGLRCTPTRRMVLSYYLEDGKALTHGEVEEALGQGMDRVTLYRTLNTFEQKGLTHKVLGPNGVVKYALCSSQCDEHTHKDEHVHFHCKECGSTVCLEDIKVPEIELAEEFQVHSSHFHITGICPTCAS